MKREATAGQLYRLLYCSRNALPVESDMASEVRAIVEAARPRNAAAGVTGGLLASASGFAQALEGPRDTVERLFQHISADPRHADVSVLTFTPAPRRIFPEAPLAFCGDFRPGAVDPLSGILADTRRGDERAMTGGDLLRLLVRLVRAEDEWAA